MFSLFSPLKKGHVLTLSKIAMTKDRWLCLLKEDLLMLSKACFFQYLLFHIKITFTELDGFFWALSSQKWHIFLLSRTTVALVPWLCLLKIAMNVICYRQAYISLSILFFIPKYRPPVP